MPLPKEEHCTLADILDWPEDWRIELAEGKTFLMAPPKRVHQEITGELFGQIREYLKDKRCRVYTAPFAVRLFEREGDRPEDVDTMLEPDITVVCDLDKLDDIGCRGAPDLVIEVLSPSTARNDRITKYSLYERAGVREYWIVDPETKIVTVHLLEGGRYHSPVAYTEKATVPASIWKDFSIDLSRVFRTE